MTGVQTCALPIFSGFHAFSFFPLSFSRLTEVCEESEPAEELPASSKCVFLCEFCAVVVVSAVFVVSKSSPLMLKESYPQKQDHSELSALCLLKIRGNAVKICLLAEKSHHVF